MKRNERISQSIDKSYILCFANNFYFATGSPSCNCKFAVGVFMACMQNFSPRGCISCTVHICMNVLYI